MHAFNLIIPLLHSNLSEFHVSNYHWTIFHVMPRLSTYLYNYVNVVGHFQTMPLLKVGRQLVKLACTLHDLLIFFLFT